MELSMKEVRMAVGLNKTARKLGCSKGHLSLVLHGHRTPSKDFARKLRRMGIRCEAAEAKV